MFSSVPPSAPVITVLSGDLSVPPSAPVITVLSGDLSVPPSAPVVTVLSGDLTNGVQEGDELVRRCKAKVGRQGKGRLHWRVYRGDGPDIMSTDQRVNTSTSKIVLLTLYSTVMVYRC